MPRGEWWTKDEETILATVYPASGLKAAVSQLPKRNRESVKMKAFKMHLRSPLFIQGPTEKPGRKPESDIRYDHKALSEAFGMALQVIVKNARLVQKMP